MALKQQLLTQNIYKKNYLLKHDPTRDPTKDLLSSLVLPDQGSNQRSTVVFGFTRPGIQPKIYCSLWFYLTRDPTKDLLWSGKTRRQ
jgi:hypothetical protein